MEKEKIEIYIMHQYDEKSHFQALYESKEDIIVKDYIILSKLSLFKSLFKNLLDNNKRKYALKEFFTKMRKIKSINNLENKNIIVGIAPYDNLLLKYKDVFKKNKCIYFTSWQDWSGENFARGNIKNKEKFENILSKYFYSAACVTKKTESEIKFLFKKTGVVNHSIYVNQYAKKVYINNQHSKKILYLGQLIKRKNIDLLVEWINEYSEKEKFEFHFAGDGCLKETIQKLEMVNSNVNYLGKLSKSEIKKVLKDYDFLVLPSKEEPFGIVLIEALASGVPCIVSDCYGPKEIITNNVNGFIFKKESKEDFWRVMDIAINIDDKKYNEMIQNCINESNKYDIEQIYIKWKEILI